MGAFDAKSHAAEATAKADDLFQNDQVPAFQYRSASATTNGAGANGGSSIASATTKGANASGASSPAFAPPNGDKANGSSSKKKSVGVGLVFQKELAWSAMHLLFYLETECQRMAKEVSSLWKLSFMPGMLTV